MVIDAGNESAGPRGITALSAPRSVPVLAREVNEGRVGGLFCFIVFECVHVSVCLRLIGYLVLKFWSAVFQRILGSRALVGREFRVAPSARRRGNRK